MKFRFLFILTLSLILVGTSLSIFFSYYLAEEKIELVDHQLRESALVLVNSELQDLAKINLDYAENLINEELGTNRIGKLFYIRNNNKQVIFKSKTASLVKYEFPQTPKKYSTRIDGKLYRVLNLELPKKSDRTLQVAIILDTEDFELAFVFKKLIAYMFLCITPIVIISFFLTNYLLIPLKLLSLHLEKVGGELKKMGDVSELPNFFDKYLSDRLAYRDEFQILLKSIASLLEKINLNYKITKPWSYQLAHEIKTPLAILNMDIEALKEKKNSEDEIALSMKLQVNRISQTVTDFLAWATMEIGFDEKNLFAVKAVNYVESLVDDLNKIYPERLLLDTKSNFVVICNPNHLIQVISNILINALKYTTGQVFIELIDYKVIIRDQGEGISQSVLARLGQPFNFGNERNNMKGTGLGLAWVLTLAKHYNWEVELKKEFQGQLIAIDFSKSLYGSP